jgi:ATP-dependent Clp protease ATP-binding subunit ClpC
VVAELKRTKLVILLIDEVHTVVTAGSAEGALGAGNMLKPSLARGELQVLGATTFTEYTKYIEKDAAMERRFQPVKVPEPSAAETLEILYGIRSKYENHHNVVIEDDALRAAAELSERHISDRFLPDKAIDLVDQSSSRAQVMGLEYSPEVVDLKSKLEKLTTAKSKALRQKDFRKAMTFKREEKRLNKKLRTGLHKLRVKMAKIKKLSEVSENQTLQPIATVDKKMVVECVSIWTRTPIHEVTSDELATLNEIRDKMNEVVIAQELAVECVACAVRRARTALRPEGRPLANFLFCGPTGVGKTELAKVCCTFFFGSSDRMVRFDMSEYTERHSVAKMIGSPPGYQGYEDTGRLTESVRNTPYTMILFDEVEKAHPWVHNVFLQILEDGRLSDGKGRLVDFCNTLIIMTSNIGSDKVDWFFSEEGKTDWYKNHLWRYPNKTKAEHLLTLVYPSLQLKFKPEILNRIDEVVVFESMNLCAAWQIAMLMVDKLDARLNDKLGIGILISIEACQKIAKDHFEPEFGARPIRRAVTKIIEDPITDLLLYKKVKRGDYLIFHTKDVENEPVEMRFVIPGDRPDRDESGNVKIWTLARESMPKTAATMKKLYAPKDGQ